MIEKIGNNEVIVNDYTSNHNIKELIHENLIPKSFPNVPMNKLNIGFNGLISEYISQVVEDVYSTNVLMMNESFINKAILDNSIYSEASIYDLGYSFATPSKCDFALQLALDDIIKYSEPVPNSSIFRYVIDKDTRIILGENSYKLDYDINIDSMMQNGRRIFKIYYDIKEKNSISILDNKYIKYQSTTINWLVLFINLKEFDRKVDEESITDNLITTNSDIEITWDRQIAGIDLIYIDPLGNRFPMKLKIENTNYSTEPFVWYKFKDDNTMILCFSSNEHYWTPDFNSKIEYTIYTCNGSSSNFDFYDNKSGIPVEKTSERFSYNASTRMVALCYGGSVGGIDKGNIEDLRNDVIIAKNSCNSLGTITDIELWFEKYANKFGNKSKFFKRRDDPSGQLFSQFISINDDTYTYPTATLTIGVNEKDFDFKDIDREIYTINAGNLWIYDKDEKYVIPYRNEDKKITLFDLTPKMIDDFEYRPDNSEDNESNERINFLFTNPFILKYYKNNNIAILYNYLLDHTSWPDDIPLNINSFYQFQLATFNIKRSLSSKEKNAYHIELICVPSVTNDKIKYIEGIGDEFPVDKNRLRIVLVIQTKLGGEVGYIEMKPTKKREAGSFLFEIDIFVIDNILPDNTVEIDLEKTKNITSLISSGDKAGKVFIDIEEPRFHFVTMMKDPTIDGLGLFNNSSFDNYTMTNRFINDFRNLQLYKSMSMMRCNVVYDKKSSDLIRIALVPFLKYNIPLDDNRMTKFIQLFNNQYKAMEPIVNKIEGNAFLDFKFFNSYGRSYTYYVGPDKHKENLRDSDIILNDLYVRIKLKMAVYDRSIFTQTADEVKKEIISFFDKLNSGDSTDVHVSNIIKTIESNHPNVKYLRFLSFNKYDSYTQSIFVKFLDMDSYNIKNIIQDYVPELIIVDNNSIIIEEEI